MAEKYWWQNDEQKSSGTNSGTSSGTSSKSNSEQSYWWKNGSVQSTIANNITERVNTWLKNHNNYLSNYQSRYKYRKYDYDDPYVKDSASWLETVSKQKSNFDAEADSILAYMDQYKGYLDAEWEKSIRDTLTSARSQQAAILDYSSKDNEWWSNFKDEEEYKTSGRYYGYNQKYSGQQYDFIKDALMTLGEGEEKEWLRTFQADLLGDTLKGNEDFQEYVTKGADLDYTDFGTTKRHHRRHTSATSIDKYRAASMALYEHNGNEGAFDRQPQYDEQISIYRTMTDDEFATLAYCIAKDKEQGTNLAEQYIDSIEETLNVRRGHEISGNVVGKPIRPYLFGAVAGIDQFATGLENLVEDNDYYIASPYQVASSDVRESLKDSGPKLPEWLGGASLGQGAYDLTTTTFNMAPSILVSTAVGAVNPLAGTAVGSALMGTSAAGNAYSEAINRGFGKKEAKFYAGAIGASESCLQFALGGVGKLGGVSSNLTKAVSGIENGLLRFSLQYGGKLAAEGIEEGLQEILDPIFQNAILNADAEIDWSNVAYSALLGARSAGVLEAGSTAVETRTETKLNKQAVQQYGEHTSELIQEGLQSDPKSESYKLAQKYQKQVEGTDGKAGKAMTGTQIRDLVTANDKQFAVEDFNEARNQAKDRLKELGENNTQIWPIAELVAKRATGQELTRAEKSKLARSEFGAQVAKEMTESAEQTESDKGYNITYKSMTDRVGEEGRYGVSESGQTTIRNENEPVTIAEVTKIEDGQMTVKLEDGREVYAGDIDFGSDTESFLYSAIADMENITSAAATALVKNFDATSEQSAQEYVNGIDEAYTYGYHGYSVQDLKAGNFTSNLSSEQMMSAYKLGQSARAMRNEAIDAPKVQMRTAKQAAISKKQATQQMKNAFASDDVEVYFEDCSNVVKFDEHSHQYDEKRMAGVNAAKFLSKMGIGSKYFFYESYENSDGVRVYKDSNGNEVKAPNGIFKAADGSVHIDINAGNNGEGTTLFTLGHELGHFVKANSAKQFQALSELVKEAYDKTDMTMHERVVAKQNQLSEIRGEHVTYDEAFEEVVADAMSTMFTDGNIYEKLAQLKTKDKGLFNTIKRFFDKLISKFKEIYASLTPDQKDAQDIRELKDMFDRIQDAFAKALVEASDNFHAAMESVVEANAESISADEIITDGAVVTDGEGEKHSIRSMKHDIAEGKMFEDLKTYCNWTDAQVKELRNQLTALVEYMTPHRDILDMNEAYGREGRRFSPYKPNSDPLYKISMDFSTLCSKRLLTQYVIENLQLRENRPMSAEEQMAIRDMLNEYRKVEKGLQVACAMCYVEAARLKSPKQIQRWLEDPTPHLINYFALKNSEFNASVKNAQANFKESKGYDRNAPKKDMKPADVKELNKIGPKLRSQYQLSAEEQAIVEKAKTLPNSTYLTAGNLANLSETDPAIYDAYTAFVRTATRSKSLETDESYYYGDSRRDNGNGIIVSDSFIEAVNRENGMRFSSWSDWRIQHMLDYITAVIDNSVRGAAMHGYTKFGEEVRVLGKTGMMFNMSGVAGTQNGLNPDGSLSFSDTESIDVNEAIKLRDEFPDTAGLQCIGVSNEHIIELLRSDIIDYVIPYHVSGLNAALRRMADIHGWKDYTSTQHAAIDKSIKFENAVDQEYWHEEPVYSEFFVGYDTGMTGIEAMRASAEKYKQLCKDRGLKPKFEQFAQEENYWKLLIDRKMVNQKTGKLIQQRAVTPTFDFDAIKQVVDSHVQNYDAGLEKRALNHIVDNWDSIPNRIKDLKKGNKVKKSVDTLANQTLAAQSKESSEKHSDRTELSTSEYNRLTSKKPINVTSQEMAMIRTQRKSKYSSLEENDIPIIDFFRIGDYRSINNGFIYYIRNSGADTFSVVMKKKIVSDARRITREVIEDENRRNNATTDPGAGQERGKRGLDRSSSERTGNGRELSENDQGAVHSGESQRDLHSGQGNADSRTVKRSDRDYMAAVKRGDMETAQRMVDQAANKAFRDSVLRGKDGKLIKMYHGSGEKFNVFRGKEIGGVGNYFSPWESFANEYGETRAFYINLTNPAIYDYDWNQVNEVAEDISDGIIYVPEDIESVIDPNKVGDTEIVVYDSSKIKSADPVTYDDSGNVIPLSERFKQENEDIRYSDRDYVAYDSTAILKESKVDEYLYDYAAKDSPKYAQAYIAYMRPRDFLHLTTDGIVERYYIDEQAGELDEERLSKSRPGVYLRIDHETGEVTGHEGRHRMSAMANAGIDRVPVLFVDTSNKMTKTDIAQITLHGQFDATEMGVVRDLIPLNFENRDRVIKNFATQSSTQRIGERYGFNKTLRFSERTDDSVSNRSLLANAFEGIVQSSVEYKMLQDYKDHIKQLNELETKLHQLNAEIRKIRFGTEGARDTARLTQLEDKAKRIAKDINRYDKRLLNMEASEPLRKVIDREKAKASQKTREHVKEIQQTKKVRADQTELRHKIRKTVRDLDKILNRGNKKLNVKEDMQVVVNKALKAADILFTDNYGNYDILRNGIGTDLSDAEEELVNTCTQMLKDIDRMPTDGYESWQARQEAESRLNIKMSKLKDVFARERKRLNNTTVSSILGELADAYASLEKSEQSYVQGAYTEAVHNFLKSLQSEVGGTIVKDMTKSQLESVYAAYQMVLNTVRNANKMFNEGLKQSREQLGNAVIQEVTTAGGTHGLWTKGEAARSQASWNNMKPVWVANRIGSETFGKLMNGLFKGQYNFAVDVDEAKKFKLEMDEKYHPRNWDAKKLYSFESSTGRKFELNLQQIMSLYAFSKREQAYSHLLNGGFAYEDNSTVIVDKNGIKRTYLRDGATSYKLNEVTLNEIVSTLTADQKAYVDEMQKYLSDVMGAKGNEVSMKLYGIQMFKEKNYFPLRSSGAYMEKAKEAEMKKQQGQINIVNSGFTHAVKPEAKNTIILAGFLDVWAEHCNEMSMYHSMVLPMEDFRKVYNYSTVPDEKTDVAGVYAAIKNAYGKAATGYIDQLYRELNAGATVDPRETDFKARISKFKKAAVMLSASVVVQQFSSIGRAYAVIDPKYFVGTKVKSDTNLAVADEMKKYAPVAIIKEMGGFDTGTKGSAKNFIMAEEYHKGEWIKGILKDEQFRGDIMSYFPAKADELTWCNIWEAVKRETKAKHSGMDVTSEAFLKLAGERFSEIIEKTQVYDSVLARSANMRSKGGLMSMATAFMAEPTTTINLLEDALRGRSVKNIARAFGAVATSILLNNALASIIYAMRDDDDDETFIEKYFQSFASGMVDDINPMTYYPFLKDVYSIFQGYDVERADMSVIADLRDALKQAYSAISKYNPDMDEDELSEYYKSVNGSIMSVLDAGCSALGVPLKNVRRDAIGVINAYQTISKDLTERDTSWNTFWDKVGSAVKDTIPIYAWTKDKSKQDKLYEAIMSGDKTYLGRIKSTYKTEDAYTSAVRKVLRENDSRIREAAEAKYETNSTEYKRIFREIQSESYFSFDDIMSAINAEISDIKKEREPKSATSEYSATEFVNAVILGEVQHAETMRDEIIATKIANGDTREEAEESFAGSVSTSTRKAFDSNLLDEAGVEKMLTEYAGMDEEEAVAKTSYWAFIKANPKYREILSQDHVEKYHEFAEPENIPLDVFAQYVTGTKGLETIRDKWGDEVKSKREQVLEVIDSLPLTWQQKDALYLAAGYAESKILDVPW